MNRGPHVPDRRNRSKRTGPSPNKVVPIHEGAEALRASLDDTDLAIVRALQANARATYTEIGRAVGLSAASVHERAHRLEARGVIRGYHAEVDPEVLGLEVLSLVSVLSSDSIDAAATEAGMAAIRQVETAYNVAGEDSYLLVVRTRSIAVLTIAFGLRNLPEPGRGLLEFRRVLRPGGRLVVCEFSQPVVPVLRGVYRRYLTRLMPVAARRLT